MDHLDRTASSHTGVNKARTRALWKATMDGRATCPREWSRFWTTGTFRYYSSYGRYSVELYSTSHYNCTAVNVTPFSGGRVPRFVFPPGADVVRCSYGLPVPVMREAGLSVVNM